MFSRRWLINFLLVVLIILFTYIGNRYDVKTGFQPKPIVAGLDPAKIERVKLETNTDTLLLHRNADDWWLQEPIRWPTNAIKVAFLIDIVNRKTDSLIDADEIDLKSIGLDFPQATMQLGETRILFGKTNNIGERRYSLIDGTVFLLPDLELPLIRQGLAGIVDASLLPSSLHLRSLQLPDLEITRNEQGHWRANGNKKFTQQQLTGLVQNWQNLEAPRITAFDKDTTALNKIRAILDDDQIIDFFLLSIDPEIVIAHPRLGLQYHFRADFYYRLISLRADEISS